MSAEKVRVAIVGGGRTGTPLLKALLARPFVEVVGLADMDLESEGACIAREEGAFVCQEADMLAAKGAEIDLGEDIIGYLRASEISRDRVEDARNVLKEGDEVSAVVVNVDRKTRNIQLSVKAKDNADQQEAMASLSQQSSRESAGLTSLGALLRAKLDSNESK